ncbi:MAG TPA: M28 family peptidase [Thermoanaerobaculia bacterium]
MNRRAVPVLVMILIVAVITAVRLRGPEPKPATANQFSAVRALQAEKDTIGGTIPHPSGSKANHAVRDRIVARLQALGWAVKVDKRFACSAHPLCADVENIMATRPGDKPGPPVLLTVHYDSVPAGPGASDDGIGVASALEIARIVRTEKTKNPVAILIDDGEELGLLGAEGFVQGMPSVGAVVNLEARGTSGPSYLFETSANNRWFLGPVARSLPMPVTTSLFASIYDRLPNDTDLTVFKREGMTGVNFAPIGNINAYHTPNDDIAHVELRTLQHQGDNALAAVRTFANMDLHHHPGGSSVWFDVLGFFLVSWPESWTLVFAIVSLLIAIAGSALREGRRETLIGFLLFLLSLIVAALIGIVLGLGSPAWIAHPWPLIAAAALAGFVVSILRRGDGGIAIGWNLLAVVVAVLMPGASYLFIVPGLFLGIALFTVDFIAPVIAALIWAPLALVIYDALGSNGLVVVAVAGALVGSTVPFVARWGLRSRWPVASRLTTAQPYLATGYRSLATGYWSLVTGYRSLATGYPSLATAAVVVILLAATGRLLPAYTATQPQRINIDYFDDGTPHWLAAGMNSTLAGAAQFRRASSNLAPWSMFSSHPLLASAPKLNVPPVLVSREGSIIHVRSQRNADRVILAIQGKLPSLRVNGITPPPRPKRFHTFIAPGWTRITVSGSSMDVDVGTTAPLRFIATDMTYAPPFEARKLIRTRDISNAVPSDDGDVTITQR